MCLTKYAVRAAGNDRRIVHWSRRGRLLAEWAELTASERARPLQRRCRRAHTMNRRPGALQSRRHVRVPWPRRRRSQVRGCTVSTWRGRITLAAQPSVQSPVRSWRARTNKEQAVGGVSRCRERDVQNPDLRVFLKARLPEHMFRRISYSWTPPSTQMGRSTGRCCLLTSVVHGEGGAPQGKPRRLFPRSGRAIGWNSRNRHDFDRRRTTGRCRSSRGFALVWCRNRTGRACSTADIAGLTTAVDIILC
jgi:hypothetical protein